MSENGGLGICEHCKQREATDLVTRGDTMLAVCEACGYDFG